MYVEFVNYLPIVFQGDQAHGQDCLSAESVLAEEFPKSFCFFLASGFSLDFIYPKWKLTTVRFEINEFSPFVCNASYRQPVYSVKPHC
jgi:hypothetical protein